MKFIKFFKRVPIHSYVLLFIIIAITTFILRDIYLTMKGNDILESLLSENVYHIEVQVSDSELNQLYKKNIYERNEVKDVIETLNQFDGRTDYSEIKYFNSKHHNYNIVLNSDKKGVFIHIINRAYMELMYFDKEKREYSKRYELKGEWLVEDIVDLFNLNDELADYVSEEYMGPPLTIGVVGQIPLIREEHITFEGIDINDLKSKDLIKTYDAVFIGHPHLMKASEKEYVELYKSIDKPVFFIDVESSITPFTLDSYTLRDGMYTDNYIVGLYYDEDQMTDWKYKLHNNIENKKNIEHIYSRMLDTIYDNIHENEEVPVYDLPPMISWKNQVYYLIPNDDYTDDDINKKIGFITSVISGNKTPSEHGEANVFYENTSIYSIKDVPIENSFIVKFNKHYFVAEPVQ